MARLCLIFVLTLSLFVFKGQCQSQAFKNVMKYVDTFRNIPSGQKTNVEEMMKNFGQNRGSPSGSGLGSGFFGRMGRGMGGAFRSLGALSGGFMDGGFGSDFGGGFGDMASGGMDMASGGLDMVPGGTDMMSGGFDMSYGVDAGF